MVTTGALRYVHVLVLTAQEQLAISLARSFRDDGPFPSYDVFNQEAQFVYSSFVRAVPPSPPILFRPALHCIPCTVQELCRLFVTPVVPEPCVLCLPNPVSLSRFHSLASTI